MERPPLDFAETLKKLATLQKTDSGLDELEKLKKGFQKQALDLDSGLAGSKNSLLEAKKGLEDLLKQRKTLEIEMGAMDNKITKYLGQQNEVKNNEQFIALRQEIEKTKEEKGVVEEKVLDCLFREDEQKKKIQDLTGQLALSEKKTEEGKKEIQGKVADCDKAATDKREDRRKQIAELPEDFAAGYVSLREHGKRIAVAQVLEGQVCEGCRMNVPPQTLNEIRKNLAIQRCDCGRYLYVKD